MPFSTEMKELADKIFISALEPVRQRTEQELQKVTRSSASQGMSPASLVHKQMSIHEGEIRELSTARLNSYKTVLEQAKQQLTEADIRLMLGGIEEIANARIGSIVFEAEMLIKRTNTPFDLGWLKPNLDRLKSSIIATVSRNLEIDRQMAILAKTSGKDATAQFVFIIMSLTQCLISCIGMPWSRQLLIAACSHTKSTRRNSTALLRKPSWTTSKIAELLSLI